MKLQAFILVAIANLLPVYAFGECSEVTKIPAGQYFWMKSEGKSDFCYQRYVSPGHLTVVTLKHAEGSADFDLRVYSDSRFRILTSSSTTSGAQSDLIVLPMYEQGRNVYLYANNASNRYGKYELYIDQIDLAELAGEAFAQAGVEYLAESLIRGLFGIDDDSSSSARNDANRAAVAFVSHLQGRNLASTTKGLLINEIRREFSGNNSFISSFIANFGVALVERVYARF